MTPPGYTLLRSRRRTLALEVTRDLRVLVRAPLRCPERDIQRFVAARAGWIQKQLERQRQRAEAHPEPTPAQRQALIARAKEVLPRRVSHYGAIMGVSPTGIAVTGARTRWGSCTPKHKLCFSWRLLAYPDEAVDYVVVHELAHLIHRNHGPAFWALVAAILPDYRARQKLLKV